MHHVRIAKDKFKIFPDLTYKRQLIMAKFYTSDVKMMSKSLGTMGMVGTVGKTSL